DQRVGELERVRGGEADAADAVDLGQGADQQAQVGNLAVAIRAAVGVDVLAEQVDLAHALRGQLRAFDQHVLEWAADLGAAGVGHHAERAVLGAAFHDRHERRRAFGTRLGQAVELLDLREADVHLWPVLLAAGADQLRQAVQGLRAEHQVHVGRALDDGFAFLRGHAAADADDDVAAPGLELLPATELAEHLFLRLLADRAGVDQHHVGFLRVVGQLQAFVLGQHVGHLGRVVLVHLATVGLDVELSARTARDFLSQARQRNQFGSGHFNRRHGRADRIRRRGGGCPGHGAYSRRVGGRPVAASKLLIVSAGRRRAAVQPANAWQAPVKLGDSPPMKGSLGIVAVILAALTVVPASAGTLYKCVGSDGVANYVSKRIGGSQCSKLGSYRATPVASRSTPAAALPPVPATRPTSTPATATAPVAGAAAASPPASSPATAGKAQRVVSGQVYSYMKDGVRHYTS